MPTYVSEDHQIHVFVDYVTVFKWPGKGGFCAKKVEMSYLTYDPGQSHLKLLLIKLQGGGESDKPGNKQKATKPVAIIKNTNLTEVFNT